MLRPMKARLTKAGPWPRSFSSPIGSIGRMIEHEPGHNRRDGDRRSALTTGRRAPSSRPARWHSASGSARRTSRRGSRLRGGSRHRRARRRPDRRDRRHLQLRAHVPGGVLPAAGVTAVGVQPTHRRRGILRRMMRAQLDAIHDRGEPLAILWASEGQIYQRFGYGLATMATRIAVARDRSAFRAPHTPAGTIRLIDVDEAKRLLPPIHDAVRPTSCGILQPHAGLLGQRGLPRPRALAARRQRGVVRRARGRRRARRLRPVSHP